MSDSASEVEPQIVDDLRVVEQGCQILGAAGARLEFWEGFTLLKVGRDAFYAETVRRDNIPPAQKDTTIRSMSPATVKLKPEFVEDLRRLNTCRQLMAGTTPAPGWELYALLLMQPEETRRTMEELEYLKGNGKPGEFA